MPIQSTGIWDRAPGRRVYGAPVGGSALPIPLTSYWPAAARNFKIRLWTVSPIHVVATDLVTERQVPHLLRGALGTVEDLRLDGLNAGPPVGRPRRDGSASGLDLDERSSEGILGAVIRDHQVVVVPGPRAPRTSARGHRVGYLWHEMFNRFGGTTW